MIKAITAVIFALVTMQSCAQIERKQNDKTMAQDNGAVVYRLFPTQNMWTFIKLNTRNGQMWQVQFSMKTETRFVSILSSVALVTTDQEQNDRFTLHATQNMYTFILLDQIDGRTWQVQWSTDSSSRAVVPIE